MKCKPQTLDVNFEYVTRKDKFNRLEYRVIGENRIDEWINEKQFKKHFVKI